MFYSARELAAIEQSALGVFICLCKADALSYEKLSGRRGRVLLPALRDDFVKAAVGYSATTSSRTGERNLLMCCVRLSPDKNPEAFVCTVETLGSALLRDNQLVPCMVGASRDPQVTAELRRRLQNVCPDALINDFVTVEELADLFSKTVLNFHPALTEAYGMTIVEAAALGAPSIIDCGGEHRGERLPC
eukprot:NODE_1436_length_1531_cov_33.452092_g1297_i0.p2 GENE.NODE_1436_length_1531_cov_33.452092_g1297_i0~~NODE_1436_length_1531_cov_33.452092_g1297_i0.p2  ORF type:complete len:190 (-),score=22.73 NODE_1436_length_1531_cov_33.452092_g1297_i0:456-1025(-)